MRGDRKKQSLAAQAPDQTTDEQVIDIRSCKMRRIPPLMWRECIKKIWEVDPLICKHCGSEMKIITITSPGQFPGINAINSAMVDIDLTMKYCRYIVEERSGMK